MPEFSADELCSLVERWFDQVGTLHGVEVRMLDFHRANGFEHFARPISYLALVYTGLQHLYASSATARTKIQAAIDDDYRGDRRSLGTNAVANQKLMLVRAKREAGGLTSFPLCDIFLLLA